MDIGTLAALLGILLAAIGVWYARKQVRVAVDPRAAKPSHVEVCASFAKRVIHSYEHSSSLRFRYGRVPNSIPLTCHAASEGPEQDLLKSLIKDRPRDAKPLLVVGEYGQGKSIACGAAAYEIARSFLADQDTGYVPVIIPLLHCSGLANLDEQAIAAVRKLYNFDFDVDSYSWARSEGRLYFVLDGLDEYLSRNTHHSLSIAIAELTDDAAFRSNRLVLTARPNVLQGLPSFITTHFDVITIDLPTVEDAYVFLEAKGKHSILEVIQKAGTGLLQDLIRRPLFLDMIVASEASLAKASSPSEITHARVYRRYFEEWFARELPKFALSLRNLKLDQVETILAESAAYMVKNSLPSIDEPAFASIIREQSKKEVGSDLDTLERQAKERLLLVPDHWCPVKYFAETRNLLTMNAIAGKLT